MIDQEQLIQALKLNGVDNTSSISSVNNVLNLFHYSEEDRLTSLAYLKTQGWSLPDIVDISHPTPLVVPTAVTSTPVTSPLSTTNVDINPLIVSNVVKPQILDTVPTTVPKEPVTPINIPIVPASSTIIPNVPNITSSPVTPVAPVINNLTASVEPTPAPTTSTAPKMTYVPPAGSTGSVPAISVAPTQGGSFIPTPKPISPPSPIAQMTNSPNVIPTPVVTPLNTATPVSPAEEKGSFGVAIFLVVLIFIILLGGIVGYAYINHMGPFEKPAPALIQTKIN